MLNIVLAVSTALGSAGTVAYYRETHSDGVRVKRAAEAKAIVDAALAPVLVDLQALRAQYAADNSQTTLVIKTVLSEALEPMRDQISTLNTKIEPLWTALINMGVNQTNVLHQPDPRRTEIDGLLEELQDELVNGHLMSQPDYARLREFLNKIKAWEPGTDIGFPVLAAEPTSAAILLSVMGLSRQRRSQEQLGMNASTPDPGGLSEHETREVKGMSDEKGERGPQGERGPKGDRGEPGPSKLNALAAEQVNRLVRAKTMPRWWGYGLISGLAVLTIVVIVLVAWVLPSLYTTTANQKSQTQNLEAYINKVVQHECAALKLVAASEDSTPPANPAQNPSRVTSYKLYLAISSWARSDRCPA